MSDTKHIKKVAQKGSQVAEMGNPLSQTKTLLELSGLLSITRYLMTKLTLTHPEVSLLIIFYRYWMLHGIGLSGSEANKSYGLHGNNEVAVRNRILRMRRLGYLQVCSKKKHAFGWCEVYGPTERLIKMLDSIVVSVPVVYEPAKVKAVRKRKANEVVECDF